MVRLPVELYENVFKHCYRFDLITLSRVSRTTQPEAERILYHHVAFLSSTNIRAVVYAIMFCKQILQSPRRAAYVKSLLSVIWVLKHNNFLLALRKLFSRAIASMPHLRTLRVVKSELLDFMILSQSPIKLWHFGSDSTEKTALLRFLVTQGELRSMSLMARIAGPNSRPTSILPRSLPPHLFPGLTVLIADAHDASRLVPGCPISHLYLYNNPVYLLANLSGGSNMIKVFRAENVSHNIMQTIPGAIPGVEVLRMSCRVAALNEIEAFVLALSRLKSLRCLELSMRPDNYSSWAATVAESIIKACPSLQTLILMKSTPSHTTEDWWIWKSGMSEIERGKGARDHARLWAEEVKKLGL